MFTQRQGRAAGSGAPGAYMKRRTRAAERGLTLIEMIVTVAVMTLAVVGIAGAMAATERIASVTQDQAQLELAMRQLSDFVRDSTPSTGLAYRPCARSSDYIGRLPPKPAGVTNWTVTAVYESTSGSRQGLSSTPVNTSPLRTCSGTCPGASCVGDWGVQEITLRVSDSARSLTRVVWKSNSW
jgi:type II secretory pathway pseudopilin PulG